MKVFGVEKISGLEENQRKGRDRSAHLYIDDAPRRSGVCFTRAVVS